jgi:iron complex outermembrane receptor protein
MMKATAWLLMCAATCAAAQTNLAGTDLEDQTPIPLVLTPTRLRQSLLDVPASVTQISADQLKQFGITSVPEALRLVPGMAVTQASGSLFLVNYHGTTSGNPRRMNVLIDGVSVYHPGLAEVDWGHLPIAVEDIERIEVTRGPDSAAYGPNSMLAIINIVTVKPHDAAATTITVGAGGQKQRRAHASHVIAFEGGATRLTASRESDDGFDWLNAHNDGHDSTSTARLGLATDWSFGAAERLSLRAWLVQGNSQVPFTSDFEGYPDTRSVESYVSGTYFKSFNPVHELRVQLSHSNHVLKQPWSVCLPAVGYLPELYDLYQLNAAFPYEILLGVRPVGATQAQQAVIDRAVAAVSAMGQPGLAPRCGTTNGDIAQSRGDIEVEDTFVLSDALRFVGGGGARVQRAASTTYLSGRAQQVNWRAFANAEFRPTDGVEFNLGGYADHDRLAGTTFSPRLAINYRLSPNQSVRLVRSTGTRSPDLVEQQGKISYSVYDMAPDSGGATTARFFGNAAGVASLRPERIESYEVGYAANVRAHSLHHRCKAL